MSTNYYDAENNKLIPIAGKGDFPADYGTKEEFETKKDSLPDGTVFTTTDEFVDAHAENYSTDEMVIGTWIDGKPLYRKVFYSENSAFVTATQYPVPYAKKLIEYSLMYRNDYGDFVTSDAKLYNKGLANAYLQIPSPSYGGGTCWIVKYTKATDD